MELPERSDPGCGSIENFREQEFLSDITIVSSASTKEIKAHKIILAAGAEYFYEYFKQTKDPVCKAPQLIPTQYELAEDPLLQVLKYLYANQNFSSIQQSMTFESAVNLYSCAYILRVQSLMDHLEQYFLSGGIEIQATSLYLEGIRFDNKKMIEVAEKNVIDNIETILSNEEEARKLVGLPYDIFKALCGNDNLNIKDEASIAGIIKEYILARENLPEELAPLAKINSDARNRKPEGGAEEKDSPKTEAKKAPEPSSSDKPGPEKNDNPPVEAKEEAKKEGEEAKKDDAPPENKAPDAPKEEKKAEVPPTEPQKPKEEEKSVIEESKVNIPFASAETYSKIEEKLKLKKLSSEEKIGLMKCIRFSFLRHKELLKLVEDPVFGVAKDLVLQGLSLRLNQYEEIQEEKKIDFPITRRAHYETREKEEEEYPPVTPPGAKGFPKEIAPRFKIQGKAEPTASEEAKKDILAQSVTNPYMRKNYQEELLAKSALDDMKGKQLGRTSSPRPPQRAHYQPALLNSSMKDKSINISASYPPPPEEFVYTYDFDEGGLMYFLGTLGKTRPWKNPHSLGQVTVFGSSIGYGSFEDIVGRAATNCRTLNEPMSYFGIDIGTERSFFPTSYTLRNRNISSHTLLNWQFEASNDKAKWKVLDRRVYLTLDPKTNADMEAERVSLIKKGATSTWGIDYENMKDQPTGYRYFRILQIGKNSSGSDNLSLSGVELYGRIIFGRFP